MSLSLKLTILSLFLWCRGVLCLPLWLSLQLFLRREVVAAVDFDRLRLAFCSKTLPKSPFFYVLELTFASKNPLLTSWLSILALVLRAFTQSSAPAVPVLASPVNRDAIAGNVLLGSLFCYEACCIFGSVYDLIWYES